MRKTVSPLFFIPAFPPPEQAAQSWRPIARFPAQAQAACLLWEAGILQDATALPLPTRPHWRYQTHALDTTPGSRFVVGVHPEHAQVMFDDWYEPYCGLLESNHILLYGVSGTHEITLEHRILPLKQGETLYLQHQPECIVRSQAYSAHSHLLCVQIQTLDN